MMTVNRRLLLGLGSLVLPFLIYWLLVVTVGLDLFDLSSSRDNTIVVVAAGVLAGLIVGFGFGLRDWRMAAPPLGAGVLGLGIYPLLNLVDPETTAYLVVWLGQSIALYLTVWFGMSRRGPHTPEALDTRDSRTHQRV